MTKPQSRQKAGKRRRAPTKTSWRPGTSGNPGGRPKLDPDQKAARIEAQAILDAATPAAAEMLVKLMGLGSGSAAGSILDRADIKGTNRLQITGADGGPVQFDLKKLSDEEARALNAYLKKAARDK